MRPTKWTLLALGVAALALVGATAAVMVALTGSEGGSTSQSGPASPDLPDYHGDGRSLATEPTDKWNDEEKDRVTTIAREVMTAFARPSLSESRWWADLSPYLSAEAQDAYSGTDPAEVPVSRVTGDVDLVDLDSPLVAIAHVPTDAGLYAVTMARDPGTSHWLVQRITPPETNFGGDGG